MGTLCSVVVNVLQAGRSRVSRPGEVNEFFSILPAALGPGVYSASNRNEYQRHINNNASGE
jgi:hypothetical protein